MEITQLNSERKVLLLEIRFLFVCLFVLEKSFKGDYIGGSSEFRMDVCVCKESPCSKT